MIIKFNYGFFYKGKIYGWSEKKLYRLPQMIGERFYPKKECKPWKDGFLLGSDRKSKRQLQSMTVVIDKEVVEITGSDCPF